MKMNTLYSILCLIPVFALLSFICWFFAPEAKAEDEVWHGYVPPVNVEWAILAIKGAENWDKVKRPIGGAGERGEMQFTEMRWKELSVKPFRWADSRQNFAIKETHRVEIAHILDLIRQCQRLQRKPTAYLVGALHCAGYETVASGFIPAIKKDFSERVANLYHDLETKP